MSRILRRGVAVGASLGLSGCAYELSDWAGTSGDVTVTVPDTSDASGPSTTDSESPTDGTTPETSGQSASSRDEDPSSSGTLDPCNNDQLDEGETAVDCGGEQCQPCGLDLPCEENGDCESGVCAGVCLAAGCDNDETDGDETDEDCGGDCAPCANAAHCLVDADCQSGVCDGESCQAPTCEDGVKNGEEADEDCGTENCGLCENGATCTLDEQCEKGACKDAICADPQCNDTRKNGDETDTDCGGSCPPCEADQICRGPADCESLVCFMTSAASGRCAEATCEDGQQNGSESFTDCGGGMCDPCSDGDPCKVASDCQSSVCDDTSLVCAAPTCEDDVRNGEEMGIDCGSGCDGCSDGTPCATHDDCASNSCSETCQAATCEDDRLNQTESDVDCGGTCGGCSFDRACNTDADCLSDDCDTTCQPGVVGTACIGDADCLSGECDGDTCSAGFRGAACETAADCQSGYCRSDKTCGSGELGAACVQAADCASNLCSTTCSPSRFSVKTDGGTNNAVVSHRMDVRANASDPARPWKDVAFLYFFSIVSPEARNNFQARCYNGPDCSTFDSRFVAINPQGSDWLMVWRALASNNNTVPSGSVTNIDFQLNNENWTPGFNSANDYSYRTGGGLVENDKIVVCQRVDGRWAHTQGTPPAAFPDPCIYVVDACSGTAATCDVLERNP